MECEDLFSLKIIKQNKNKIVMSSATILLSAWKIMMPSAEVEQIIP